MDRLIDFNFINARFSEETLESILRDFDTTIAESRLDASHQECLLLVKNAIRLSSHVLFCDMTQLSSQLYSRLVGSDQPEIMQLLEGILAVEQAPWLRSLKPGLSQAGEEILFILEGHTGGVTGVAVTPDGRFAISGSKDCTLRVWDLETCKLLRILEGHTAAVCAVVVTPDGRRAVSGSEDCTLRVWDLETGKTLRSLEGHTGPVRAVVLTSNGRRIVSGSDDCTLRVWALETGKKLRSIKDTVAVDTVAVTPDGRFAVTGSREMQVRDLKTGKTLRSFTGYINQVHAVAITPDGRRAVLGFLYHILHVWDIETGELIRILGGHIDRPDAHIVPGGLLSPDDWVNGLAVTLDGRRVVSGAKDSTLRVWDMETGMMMVTLKGHSGPIHAVAITPDVRLAVSGSEDHTLRVWNLEVIETRYALSGLADFKIFNPEGKVKGFWIFTPHAWNLMPATKPLLIGGHTKGIIAVAITSDGRRAISASEDRTLRVWDMETGETLHILEGHTDLVHAVTITPDGRRSISGSEDCTLRVWNLKTGKTLHIFKDHTAPVRAVAVTPDGRRVISGARDYTLRVWDIKTGETLHLLEGHKAWVHAVAVTPDGRLVTGSLDHTLRVWDLKTGKTLRILKGHPDPVHSVAVTLDGRFAISGSTDKTVRVWDLETGETLFIHKGHTRYFSPIAVTPDGRHAVTSADDDALHVWNLETGETIARFFPDKLFSCYAVAPDGVTIFAGDCSGIVHFLRMENLPPIGLVPHR